MGGRFFAETSVGFRLGSVIHAKKKERIPVVFSRDEVAKVIGCMYGTKKLIAKLLYGTGMRLNEALSLRILDLDFDRNEIIIRHGKGDKDRNVMIPQKLVPELKAHIEKVQQIHTQDLADGWGAVVLPGALAGKYQGGSKEFKWQCFGGLCFSSLSFPISFCHFILLPTLFVHLFLFLCVLL